ncbi:hypothetical protein [Cerasicoccus arenae]|uniref:Uncharacterized protein n=1 Tax=Cerasicoccus arenae TaxID=424488 RepID=A0A8J3DIY1_9BACT|nr:hypothetical protein [Cerasicoccus arenae]MBK1858688.1 hypothetical protein [Cerasicoccus arenae]GHB98326.1 hypothetical protein GCM10007047_12990 [Cerasicoccus arenae]
MALTTQKRIQVEHLLLQREAAYVRVHELESQIKTIFGDTYPFPPPPEPVVTGSSPKAHPKKKRAGKTDKTTFRLRPLTNDEAAYRIRFIQDNGVLDEVHVDRKSIESVFQATTETSMISWIETIDAQGKMRERIYRANEETG